MQGLEMPNSSVCWCALPHGVARNRQTSGMDATLIEEMQALPLWKDYRPTPLVELPRLARHLDVGRIFVKVESERPLGNFKVLGGVLAGMRAIARAVGAAAIRDVVADAPTAPRPGLLCASDGNHGLAVALAARMAGTTATIHLPAAVSGDRSARIEALGGKVVRVDGTYDDAVAQAAAAAARGDGILVPDTTGDSDDVVVRDVMAGYALLSHELIAQFAARQEQASHLFVQAGVGGLAASMVQGLHSHMRDPRKTVIVEPDAAGCVARALECGHPVRLDGGLTTAAEMLSCGLASAPAIEILRRYPVESVLVDDAGLLSAVDALREHGGPRSTPSGAAGLAGLVAVCGARAWRRRLALGPDSTVLIVATE